MAAVGRVLQVEDGGQIILPADLREKLETDLGELVAIETPDGVLLTSRRTAIERDLARVDAELREHGVTLDELVESGREIRGEIARERYGLDG